MPLYLSFYLSKKKKKKKTEIIKNKYLETARPEGLQMRSVQRVRQKPKYPYPNPFQQPTYMRWFLFRFGLNKKLAYKQLARHLSTSEQRQRQTGVFG